MRWNYRNLYHIAAVGIKNFSLQLKSKEYQIWSIRRTLIKLSKPYLIQQPSKSHFCRCFTAHESQTDKQSYEVEAYWSVKWSQKCIPTVFVLRFITDINYEAASLLTMINLLSIHNPAPNSKFTCLFVCILSKKYTLHLKKQTNFHSYIKVVTGWMWVSVYVYSLTTEPKWFSFRM